LSPVSNTFPTSDLEDRRQADEAATRKRIIDARLQRLPENEKRANSRALNIISCELFDESAASASNDFPLSSLGRAINGRDMETGIIAERGRLQARDQARVSCRYNTGRGDELRDWNIVNGSPVQAGLSADVIPKPSVWEWCKTERLDVVNP
jgi:hypothetical protein